MADIQYINYGDLQVDLLALLNKMADEVAVYVSKQPWSRKRKEKFMSAYSDMLARGIQGASSNTGLWVVTVGGDDLDLNSLPRKDREMYLEAAWFIRHQMQGLAKNKELDSENKEEENKTPFGSFKTNFNKYVKEQKFGGEKFTPDLWNNFDERNKYGIRSKDNRMRMFSQLLQSYSDNVINDDNFDFKDTPFKSAANLKERIQEAITALGTSDKMDDLEKLYALGLDPKDWFDDGSEDPSGHADGKGNPLTNKQYYDAILESYKQKYKQYKDYLDKYKLYLQTVTNTPSPTTTSTKPNTPETLGQHKFTNADYLELVALIGDISSIVYPGAVGGAVLGTGAASARTAASAMRGNLNLWDRLLDHATGIIGGFPLVGDALMITKVGRGVKSFIQTAGLVEAAMNVPGLTGVIKKLDNPSSITVDEWKSLLLFFRGLTGAGRVMKSNASFNNAAKASGLETKYNWWQKALGAGPTVKSKAYSVKAKVGDKDVNVELNLNEYDNLVKDLRGVRPGKKSEEKAQEIIKKAIVNTPAVQAAKANAKVEDITVTYSPTWRSYVPLLRNSAITSQFESRRLGNTALLFEEALKNRHFKDRLIHGGSNRALRQYRKKFGLGADESNTTAVTQNNGAQQKATTSTTSQNLKPNKDAIDRYNKYINGELRTDSPLKKGEIKIGNDDIEVSISTNNGKTTYDIKLKNKSTENIIQGLDLEGAKLKILEIVRSYNSLIKDMESSDIKKILDNIKVLGWNKQGGTIDMQKYRKYKKYISYGSK